MKKRISFVVAVSVLAFLMPVFAKAQLLNATQKAELEKELAQVEADEKQATLDLNSAQAQSASLKRDINVLDAKIKAAQLNIKAKTLLIQTLGDDISVKQGHISYLEDNISKGKDTLAQILRKTNEIDGYSFPEIILSDTSISSFFTDIDTFQSVEDGLKNTFEMLRTDEASTTAEKDALTIRQNAEIDARYAIQQDQANIKTNQTQKQQLLVVSKGNEKSYASLVAEKAIQAAKIRAALFALAGGSKPIPFGDALQFAQAASAKTGVDPAFLLAILTQESNLGKNVGTCYLSNSNNGSGVNANTGAVVAKVMSPTRDIPPYLTITKALGMDPYQTVVSCPQSVGWGGAMGPSQFIASTWTLLQDRVSQMLGMQGGMPNPWNAKDAIMAEALFMSDLGASGGSYTAKLTAACKYFGGGTRCTSVTRPYGNSVMALADSIQRNQIDVLTGI